MPELPRVSVIVPVRDGAAVIRTLLDALASLDYPDDAYECIVVDNGSRDDTRQIVAAFPGVTLVEERAVQSSYAARNRGVAHATGTILAFTDADCVPDRGWLRALVGPFARADVGGVAGGIEAYSVWTAAERYQARRAIRAERAFSHPVMPFAQTANAAYPRRLFDAVGGFDATIPFGGDLDFSWRLQRATGLRLVYEPTALIRHRHRTSWQGVFALYQKNAIANCLLSRRYAHYAAYPRPRTLAYLTRECLRSGMRAALHRTREDGGTPDEHWVDVARYAGEISGWVRWRAGRVVLPTVAPGYPLTAKRAEA